MAEDPLIFLDVPCVLALEPFLHGFMRVDASLDLLTSVLLTRFPGPSQADACTRAYLLAATGSQALMDVLKELKDILRESPLDVRLRESCPARFIDAVREAIVTKRTGLVFFESTVASLYNHYSGFLWGLRVAAPARAADEEEAMLRFEGWLQSYYGQKPARWHQLLRVFGGACFEGLDKFVELWDRFEAEQSSLMRK